MKVFGIIAGFAAAQIEEFDSAEFYGPAKNVPKMTASVIKIKETTNECCDFLKVWGDVALFSGKFVKNIDETAYISTSSDLKIYFHENFNRWIVSNEISKSKNIGIRAFGGNSKCPETENWKIWNGKEFETMDLTEPWSPYVHSEKLLECRPENFQVKNKTFFFHKCLLLINFPLQRWLVFSLKARTIFFSLLYFVIAMIIVT